MQLIAPDPDIRLILRDLYASKRLLTPTEGLFFAHLQAITQGRCQLFTKVCLADIFKHLSGQIGDRNRISQKHVDFLICRHEDSMPMIGIELDDASHDNPERFKGDMLKNNVFAATGVPLLRLPVEEMHKTERIVALLTRAWHQRWTVLGAPREALSESAAAPSDSSPNSKRSLVEHLIRQARAQIAEIAA